jgi:hypothetical protein
MKKHIIIPRKDHEVYIVPFDKKAPFSRKVVNQAVQDALHALHPGFSDAAAYDSKIITLNKNKYLIITVIDKTVLTEYRLLHRRSSFYTATSLVFSRTDNDIPDPFTAAGETIGINGSGGPYSIPADNPNAGGAESDKRITKLLRKSKRKSRVFRKQNHAPWYILSTAMIIFSGVLSFYYLRENPDPPPAAVGIVEEKEIIPSSINILADISDIVLNAGGIILHWHYDENADPAGRAAVEGAEIETLLESIGKIPYIARAAISDIRYTGRKAHYELTFSFNTENYTMPVQYVEEDESFPRLILSKIRTEITNNGGVIESETLPAPENGRNSGIVFSCGDSYFERIFEGTGKVIQDNRARITYMDARFESNKFNISLAITQSFRIPEYYADSGGLGVIFTAFGAGIIPEKNNTAAAVQKIEAGVVKADKKNGGKEGYEKIGAIRDKEGRLYVYYKTDNGKIIIEAE